MEEHILKDLLQNYSKDSFNVVSYVKKGNECTANINCDIFSHSDVHSFIKFHKKETNETLKLKLKKKGNRKEYIQNKKKLIDVITIHDMKEPGILRQFSNKILSNGLEAPAVHFK